MVQLMDAYYPTLDRARREGIIDFPDKEAANVSELIESLHLSFPQKYWAKRYDEASRCVSGRFQVKANDDNGR
jgi:hypothetical protein